MVEQGDIIKIDLNPKTGHEQAGYRPALVVSNAVYNKYAKMVIVCPITNTDNSFPLHIPLDGRTQTTGYILCEHIRALDVNARPHKVIEKLPEDILDRVINTVYAQIERIF